MVITPRNIIFRDNRTARAILEVIRATARKEAS